MRGHPTCAGRRPDRAVGYASTVDTSTCSVRSGSVRPPRSDAENLCSRPQVAQRGCKRKSVGFSIECVLSSYRPGSRRGGPRPRVQAPAGPGPSPATSCALLAGGRPRGRSGLVCPLSEASVEFAGGRWVTQLCGFQRRSALHRVCRALSGGPSGLLPS